MPAHALPDVSVDRDRLAQLLADASPEAFARICEHPGVDPTTVALAVDMRERRIAEAQREGWRASPFTMARHLETAEEFAPYRFAEYLSDRFVDAVSGVAPLQVWNLPAQLGKSSVARRAIAWALDRRPEHSFIYTSYGSDLASSAARWIRDYGERHSDQLRFQLRPDARRTDEWLTTEGGGLKAAGLKAGISGFPASGGIVIDDPHRNWQEAHSEAQQEAVWDVFRSVLRIRVGMGGFMIVIQTAWAERDLRGRLLEFAKESGEEWLHVRLPMLAEEGDLLGRAVGEPLEPARFDLAACQSRAKALGSYLAAALEQQDPQPAEGGLFKRHWWHVTEDIPERFDELLSSWDVKMKDVARKGDFVAGQVWGRVGAHFWLLDQARGQFSGVQLKAAVAMLKVRYPMVNRHIMENTGNGPEVMEDLKRGMGLDWVLDDDTADEVGVLADERDRVQALLRRGISGLVPNNPKGDKRVRAIAVQGIIESGHVHIRRAPFADVVIGEAAAFPNGAHDDTVDAWSQALAILSRTPGTTSIVKSTDRQIVGPTPGQTVPPARTIRSPGSAAGRTLGGAGSARRPR
jgi:phage terminase large subunit-like protein